MKEETLKELKIVGENMLCPKNASDIQIWGNYDTYKAANLMIVFEKCECKSDKEI
jgi:hypothetical protein